MIEVLIRSICIATVIEAAEEANEMMICGWFTCLICDSIFILKGLKEILLVEFRVLYFSIQWQDEF